MGGALGRTDRRPRALRDPRALSAATEAAALRVVQEALANAAEHAAPSHVWVSVEYRADGVRVDACDDEFERRTLPDPGPVGEHNVGGWWWSRIRKR
ncbi:hypothetical protein [Embleya sp. NPDC020630]|uniref:hypothetical protein n=1 Tax=Embleya sp. NPDC020630 TaxID=3363979 RepID=UPI0037A9E033